MPTKNIAKTDRDMYLETLQGLQTLVQMQQVLIMEAIGRLDEPDGARKKTTLRSTARKTKPTA